MLEGVDSGLWFSAFTGFLTVRHVGNWSYSVIRQVKCVSLRIVQLLGDCVLEPNPFIGGEVNQSEASLNQSKDGEGRCEPIDGGGQIVASFREPAQLASAGPGCQTGD